jgi:hypothetical protein
VARAAGFADAIAGRYGMRTTAPGMAMVPRLAVAAGAPARTAPRRILAPLHLRLALAFNWSGGALGRAGGPGTTPHGSRAPRSPRHLIERLAQRTRRIEPELPPSAARHRPSGPHEVERLAPHSAESPGPIGDDRTPVRRTRLDVPTIVHRHAPNVVAAAAVAPADPGHEAGNAPVAPRLPAVARSGPGRPAAGASIDVERVATEVLTVIDRRLAAHRERVGRV